MNFLWRKKFFLKKKKNQRDPFDVSFWKKMMKKFLGFFFTNFGIKKLLNSIQSSFDQKEYFFSSQKINLNLMFFVIFLWGKKLKFFQNFSENCFLTLIWHFQDKNNFLKKILFQRDSPKIFPNKIHDLFFN